jgi:intein/homing endonuclease
MAFHKIARMFHKCSIRALNTPKGEGWDIYDLPNQIKTASTTVQGEDLGGFDLKQATKEHPDHLYVKIFAIKKDEPNDNGDSFSEGELKKAADTFVGVPLFTNHQNDDVEKARGECVHSWYDEDEGGIFIIGRVDKIAYPRLARGIEEGYITGCFPPDAPVLMADGTEKSICDIEDGDEVISGKGNVRRVLGIRQRGYNYPLFSIRVEGLRQPLVCTSHHNLMVYRLPEMCACGCEESLAIKKDTRITAKTFNRKFKTGHNLRGESAEFNHEYVQKIKACELREGDFLIEPKFVDDSCDSFVTEDEAFLIGLFLAKGSFEKRQGVRHSVIFNFGYTELETLAFRCEEKMREVFSSHRNEPTTQSYPDASQSRVSLYGKDVAQWFFERCGEYSDQKKLHPSLLRMGVEKTSALLAGMIEGDGYNVKGKTYGVATVSPHLSSQLRILFEKIGVRSNYRIRTEDNIRWGYKPVHEITWGVTTTPDVLRDRLPYKKGNKARYGSADWHNLQDVTLRRIKKVEEVDYDGVVYDIEVEEDHTYCVNHIAVSNTSMGCSVESSICSVCHNKAHTSEDYCFVKGTPILMSDYTVKPIEDVNEGDTVIDACGKPTTVTETFRRDINEKISLIKSRCINGELSVTKNHPFLVPRRGSYRYVPSEFLQDGESLLMPVPQVVKDNLFFAKFGFDHLSHEDKKRLAAFVGYYAAKGSRVVKDGEIKAVELTFHEGEVEYIDEVVKTCTDLFGKEPSVYSNQANKHTTRVRLWKPDVAKVIHEMCPGVVHRLHDKRFDETVFSLEDEYKIELLRAFIDGDGHCDSRSNIQIVSAARGLASQILYLLLSIGSSPSFNSYRNNGGYNNRDADFRAFRISIGASQLKQMADRGVKCSEAAVKTITQSKLTNAITEDGKFALHNCYTIDETDFCGTVYNIETVSHSYVANNTSVHNCTHIANRKNRKYSGEIKCAYHDSSVEKDEKCPICGSTADNRKVLKHSEQPIYEHNYGLKFIENSFVVNPACHDCGVRCILHVPTITKKVAQLSNALGVLIKRATTDPDFMEANAENLVKLGGVRELEALKNSMTEVESVVKSMLKQKENISMAYVSDLVKFMAELQDTYDELVEMGYGALPSPPVTAETEDQPMPTFPEPVGPQTPTQQAPPPPAGVETSDMGGLGNITLPKNSSKNKEEFYKNSQKLLEKVDSLEKGLRDLLYKSKLQLEMGAKMATEKNTKTAASADNLEVITEKQLMKQEESLHPRTETVYEGITESKEQIGGSERSNDTTSDSPQVRKGTYDTITEDQLKTKSALGDAVIHFNEYPDVITEKQWNDFSRDVAGDLPDDYTEQITQAQIRELLSKHKFIGNVETITEDQLRGISMTEGLKRWANKSYAISLLKTATNIVADLISTFRKSPDEIRRASSIISDDSKVKEKVAFLAVMNSLPYKADDRKTIASKARYFSKTASANVISTMDALIVTAADQGQFGQSAEDVLDFVHNVVNDKKAMAKVEALVAAREKTADEKVVSKVDAFASAMNELDKEADGRYQIKTTLAEIGTPVTDKVAFLKSVKKYAQDMIGNDSVAAAVIEISVGDNGELIIDVQDANMGAVDELGPEDIGDAIEGPVKDIDADINGGEEEGAPFEEGGEEPIDDGGEEPVEEEKDMATPSAPAIASAKGNKVAAAKREVKKAQMMGGEMGGMGGASQAPGAGATMPAAPPMGAPPMESFTGEEGMEGEPGAEDSTEPLPPGSICPVCGSEDVDVISGKGKCNSCTSEFVYKVDIDVTKWQGLTPSEDGEPGEEGAGEEGFEGEGFEMPGGDMGAGAGEEFGAEMPAVGASLRLNPAALRKFAAVTRLKPEALKKAAAAGIKLGSVSPETGTTNTVKIAEGEYVCLDTGTHYKVSYVLDAQNPKKGAYAQWEWKPRVAGQECPSCVRAKKNFIKALASINMTESKFKAMDIKDQVATISKLTKAGALKTIKTASKHGSIVGDFKLAYGNWGDKFPYESCLEKLARRFGENAVCLSGPDEGKPLAQSICNRLKKADIYSDKVAIKLAGIWSDCDGDEDCVTHQVRMGFNLREAASVCQSLKVMYAQAEDFLSDELSDVPPPAGPDGTEEPMTDDMGGEDIGGGVDPFEDAGTGGGEITLTLPADIAEQLGQQLDQALGGDVDTDGVPNAIDTDTDATMDAPVEGDPMGEAPVDEAPVEDAPIEEVTPEDLATDKPMAGAPEGMEEEKPMQAAPAKPCTDPAAKKPCTGFEAEQPQNDGMVEKNKGVSKSPQNVQLTMNGQPVQASAEGYDEKEAMNMHGAIGKVGKPQMDLAGVIAVLEKQAADKQINQEKAQDSSDIGSYTAGDNGSLMGHENETIPSASKPSVPRNNATMGQEPSDLNPQDKPLPTIPSGDATMGHEKEVGLSGGDARYTGGDKGQGKTDLASADLDLLHMRGYGSTKDSLARFADRLATKLAPKAPVADDKDVKPYSGDSTIGKEEKFTADEPKNTEGSATESLIGHEKETIGNAPKSPADHPDVFTGNAQQGQEELNSEKTTKDKGTVIANSDSESEAIRVAGRMLQARKIDASELQGKIGELKGYKPEQIRDIEKAIFAQKGLDSVSDGLSRPVQINEASSVRNAQDDLRTQLQGMFTLGRQNKLAETDETTQLRQAFRK